MNYKLLISDNVKKALKKMDRYIATMLLKTIINEIGSLTNPRDKGKSLSGDKKGLWRYRIGKYRLICKIDDDELTILALEIGKRDSIYK